MTTDLLSLSLAAFSGGVVALLLTPFEAPLHAKLQRRLAAMIEAKIANRADKVLPASLITRGAAAGQVAKLQMWLSGKASCRSGDLANALAGVRRRAHA